jgi:hypothetical protein
MLREDIKGLLKATPRDLRKFGLAVGVVFVLLAPGLFYLGARKPWAWYFLVPGLPLILLGMVFPRSLKWVYVGWMTLAMILGAIVSTILLTLLFYFVVTPIGLVSRLAGKDFLSRKLDPKAASYWILRDASKPKEKHEHERQF